MFFRDEIRTEERAALQAALLRLGIEPDDEKQALLLGHLRLVLAKNRQLNLTRITGMKEALVLHIEDSLAALEGVASCGGSFCDIGTGGGFPGIPLGIVSGRRGTLLDSVKKKAGAVQGFIDEIGLSNQLVCLGERSEDHAREHPAAYRAVVVRAVSSLPVVLELAAPLLAIGGKFIALRGEEPEAMVFQADVVAELVGMQRAETKNYTIGCGELLRHRSLYVYEKIGEPQVALPRRSGMATKRPLADMLA